MSRTRFVQASFFISSFAWHDYYRTIFRTSQVLSRVPAIQMDAARTTRACWPKRAWSGRC